MIDIVCEMLPEAPGPTAQARPKGVEAGPKDFDILVNHRPVQNAVTKR